MRRAAVRGVVAEVDTQRWSPTCCQPPTTGPVTRDDAFLGLVGAGGIGQELIVAIRKFYYSDVSAILVTNNYHMPRSLLEMRRANSALTIVPYPVVNTPLGDGEWIRQPDALRVLFTEYTKYIAALARSLLDSPDPMRIEASAPANKS